MSQTILKFDDSKSENPFAYVTQIMSNSFIRSLNTEKKQHAIRDDLLEMAGQPTSYGHANAEVDKVLDGTTAIPSIYSKRVSAGPLSNGVRRGRPPGAKNKPKEV